MIIKTIGLVIAYIFTLVILGAFMITVLDDAMSMVLHKKKMRELEEERYEKETKEMFKSGLAKILGLGSMNHDTEDEVD